MCKTKSTVNEFTGAGKFFDEDELRIKYKDKPEVR